MPMTEALIVKRIMNVLFHWKVILPIVSVLFAVVVVEGVFRYVFVHKDSGTTRSGFVERDADLVWRLKPRKVGPLATNELGFRDTHYNQNAEQK